MEPNYNILNILGSKYKYIFISGVQGPQATELEIWIQHIGRLPPPPI